MRWRHTVYLSKEAVGALAAFWGCSFLESARRCHRSMGRLAFTRLLQKS